MVPSKTPPMPSEYPPQETAMWQNIYQADIPVMVEARDIASLAPIADDMLKLAPFSQSVEGAVKSAVADLDGIALPLRRDIIMLAQRFAKLMACDRVRLRLEGIATDACRKIHADYTDVRLITTYAGPGTQYIPYGSAAEESELIGLPTGWIGLFKGHIFNADHVPCMHRSPPIIASGQQRLVLVIDTPLREANP